MQDSQLLINGKWMPGEGGTWITSSPYSGDAVARVSLADPRQANEAIRAAQVACRDWRKVPAYRRSDMLVAAARLVTERSEQLARTITEENGKPIRLARAEVNRAAATFRLAAMETGRRTGETIPMDVVPGSDGRFGFYIRQPIGVVAAITPFNFPLNLAVHKVAPALAVGNTVVLKPSSQTPLTALLLGQIVMDAGFPPGTLNVIPCARETAEILITDPSVAMVSFTGSVAVGRFIRERAGLKKVALELGSNSGNIVMKSADLEQAVGSCTVGGFAYAGQVCISVQRIYVQRPVMEAFMALFVPRVQALRLGDPRDEATDVGSLISDEAAERVRSWLKEAVEGGAQVLCGGKIEGRMMQPTVLVNVKKDMKVVCEEAFAPLVSVIPFDTFDEAVAMLNDSKYGLNAGVFTRDLREALEAVEELEVGSVIVNDSSAYRADHMPYGGVKSSGVGREGVRFAMEEMTEIKFAAIRLPEGQ
jgi:acyl-CoA reductase-like NAD-dependent aldehyde dehydrogenase